MAVGDLAGTTFAEYAVNTAGRVLARAGLDAGQATMRAMFASWGDRPIGTRPVWHSDVCADGSPVEFSAAFSPHGVEVRVLVEALPARPSARAAQDAAVCLTRDLAGCAGVVTNRLDAVQDLFLPAANRSGSR